MMMDLDLAEYDQVDEAKFFMDRRNQPAASGDLLITLSFEKTKSDELANCENDFVFLPAPSLDEQNKSKRDEPEERAKKGGHESESIGLGKQQARNSSASDLPHKTFMIRNQIASGSQQLVTPSIFTLDTKKTSRPGLGQVQPRACNPLTTISTNGGAGNNPFHSLRPAKQSDGGFKPPLVPQSTQPFWMRHENLANKPIGLLEVSASPPSCAQGINHLSNLMHQIVTRSDSIYIAIPCAICQEQEPCPPSNISAWLKHMDHVHNCKVCPICNRLVGLGPTRDIEVVQRHVLTHIDIDWLENKTPRTNFTTGLQNNWFSSGRCSVRESSLSGKFK